MFYLHYRTLPYLALPTLFYLPYSALPYLALPTLFYLPYHTLYLTLSYLPCFTYPTIHYPTLPLPHLSKLSQTKPDQGNLVITWINYTLLYFIVVNKKMVYHSITVSYCEIMFKHPVCSCKSFAKSVVFPASFDSNQNNLWMFCKVNCWLGTFPQ